MKTDFKFRSVVFKRAYMIVKETSCSFSEALKEAWNRFRAYRDKVVGELAKRINGFDFYYQRSDDHRVYIRWSNIEDEIRTKIFGLPKTFVDAITGMLNHSKDIKTFLKVPYVADWTKQITA